MLMYLTDTTELICSFIISQRLLKHLSDHRTAAEAEGEINESKSGGADQVCRLISAREAEACRPSGSPVPDSCHYVTRACGRACVLTPGSKEVVVLVTTVGH